MDWSLQDGANLFAILGVGVSVWAILSARQSKEEARQAKATANAAEAHAKAAEETAKEARRVANALEKQTRLLGEMAESQNHQRAQQDAERQRKEAVRLVFTTPPQAPAGVFPRPLEITNRSESSVLIESVSLVLPNKPDHAEGVICLGGKMVRTNDARSWPFNLPAGNTATFCFYENGTPPAESQVGQRFREATSLVVKTGNGQTHSPSPALLKQIMQSPPIPAPTKKTNKRPSWWDGVDRSLWRRDGVI